MLTSRENIALLFFALIAVVLITITVSLQLTIWSNQRVSADVVQSDSGSVMAVPAATIRPISILQSTQVFSTSSP